MAAEDLKIELIDPSSKTAQNCINAYYAELQDRLDHGFDPAKSVSANPDELTPPAGYFFVVYLNDQAVACAGLKIKPDFAEIKRMWVNPNARGHGIAKKLIARLEQQVLDCNLNTVRLDTHHSLSEARNLYLKSGYTEIAPYNDNLYANNWYEKILKPVHG